MFRLSAGPASADCRSLAGSARRGSQPRHHQRTDQKLMLMGNGAKLATYPVSTSKFGLGDDWGRMTTPLGFLQVARENRRSRPGRERFFVTAVSPAKFSSRTLPDAIPSSPGSSGCGVSSHRTPTPLAGVFTFTARPRKKLIGRPASYGCIRMKSRDVAALYAQLPVGAIVEIVPDRLPKVPKAPRGAVFTVEAPKPEPEKSERRQRQRNASETTAGKRPIRGTAVAVAADAIGAAALRTALRNLRRTDPS